MYNSCADYPFPCIDNSWLNTNMVESNVVLRVTDLDGCEKVKFLQTSRSIFLKRKMKSSICKVFPLTIFTQHMKKHFHL